MTDCKLPLPRNAEELQSLAKALDGPSYGDAMGQLMAMAARKEQEVDAVNNQSPELVKANDNPAIADVVAAEILRDQETHRCCHQVSLDVMARKRLGMERYGTPLQPFNGRNTHIDVYQELIDALKYARVLLYEAQCENRNTLHYERLYEDLQKITLFTCSLKEVYANSRNKGD